MPSIPLFPLSKESLSSELSPQNVPNPLPPLLQTPSGLAILELQGTINIPPTAMTNNDAFEAEKMELSKILAGRLIETELGKLMFPDYSPQDPDNNRWMKRVYLYVGRYQRMTGEVKKLAKPLAIIRRRERQQLVPAPHTLGSEEEEQDELEIVEIVNYKIVFASRPEPVGLE